MTNFYGQYIGFGSGGVGVSWDFGGESYGFMSAGLWYSGGTTNTINRFSFSSDGDASDWGDLTGSIKYSATGHSDKDNSYAYNAGGYGAAPYVFNEIARYSMASSGGSADVGDLTQVTSGAASATNATHCYSIGQEYNAGVGGDGTVVSTWAFASTVNASDWGDLMGQQYGNRGATNGTGTYGYIMGGGAPTTNRIQKANLTASSTATDVANTTVARHSSAGNSSSTHGYCSGGHHTPTHSNVTDKFNMETDADSTDVGNLTITIHQRGGASSLTYGYVCGGSSSNNTIEKHNFSSDGDSTDVGNLDFGLIYPAGSQY